MVANFGPEGYFSMMRIAAAMVGNSSSGIIEAASFGLPVVNVGGRQQGRIRGRNVIDAAGERAAIASAIEQACAPAFRESLRGMPNPYGDGQASERIVGRLRDVELGDRLLVKRWAEAGRADADPLHRHG